MEVGLIARPERDVKVGYVCSSFCVITVAGGVGYDDGNIATHIDTDDGATDGPTTEVSKTDVPKTDAPTTDCPINDGPTGDGGTTVGGGPGASAVGANGDSCGSRGC